MYKEFTKEDYAELLGIGDRTVTSLIVYGGYNPSPNQIEWCNQAEFSTEAFFYPLAIDNGIAVTNVYGDAMASEVIHIFSVLGIQKAVLIGTFGALQPGIDFGQVFLPSSAVPEDGASRMYSSEQRFFPDPKLLARAKEVWADTAQQTGDIVSVSAMLAETWDMIVEWKNKQYTGVDLESACFLAVANHFKVPAVVMHTLADNLIEQQTIMSVTDEQRQLKRKLKQELFERALRVVSDTESY